MARKPVKKRKTQRASVKRKPKSVKAKPASVKKPKPFNPAFNLKVGTPEDPFFIHPETIPDGIALQWIATDPDAYPRLKESLSSGWKLVHGCQELIANQVLMWAPQEVAKAQTQANIDRAKQQMAEARALFGMDGNGASSYHGHHLVVRIAGPEFVEARPCGTISSDAEPVDVDITIKFRVSARWQDAAACLGLDVQEYARRRLIMEDIVLAAYGYREDRAYQPVELSITRKD